MFAFLPCRHPDLLALTHSSIHTLDKMVDAVHGVFRAEMERRWDLLFGEITTEQAKCLSKKDRAAMGTNASSLVYGEVMFDCLAEIFFRHLNLPKKGGVFYDLGYACLYWKRKCCPPSLRRIPHHTCFTSLIDQFGTIDVAWCVLMQVWVWKGGHGRGPVTSMAEMRRNRTATKFA